jgi:hypothetical protein
MTSARTLIPTVSGLGPALGPTAGGTTVTLTGTGFASGAYVRFGVLGSRAAAAVTTSTLLSCVTPTSMVGPSSAEVSNNNADFSSSGIEFEFYGTSAGV